jgi:hypothetical protein
MMYEGLDRRLQREARQFEFPPTPDIAGAVRGRLEERPVPARRILTPARALLVLTLAAAAVLLAVPSARATVFEALQVGVVRILLGEPEAEQVAATATSTSGEFDAGSTPAAGVPEDSSFARPITQVPLLSELDQLAGETSLEEAQRLAGFEIRLPVYPPDLGAPDRVFYQPMGPTVILVWADPGGLNRPRLSLFILGETVLLDKAEPSVLERTEVGGEEAYWAEGPYMLAIRGERELVLRYLVQGHVLIWAEGGLTYRLESGLPLEEALRIAESLQP